MNARLAPAKRDPIGRRDPSAVDMLGLGFMAIGRERVAVVTVLFAELLAGMAVMILSAISAAGPVGTVASRHIDRFSVVLSPVISLTGPFRDRVGTDGVPSWVAANPATGWAASVVLLSGSLALVLAVGLGLTGDGTAGNGGGWAVPARWPEIGCVLVAAVTQAAGIALLLGVPLVLAAWAADRANHSVWMATAAVTGVGLVAWWGFRFLADAIVHDRSPATGAVVASVRIVMRFPGVAVRLFLLSESILLGCRAVWVGLIGSPAGLFVALVGNAMVFVALVAGRTSFYREARDILAAEQADVFDPDPLSPGIIAARS
ncbi:MAG: hypothetical protein M3P94_05395 [Chloroflexota bacterium]|nr:hypothetical protein [Chloroflexota bacterium]